MNQHLTKNLTTAVAVALRRIVKFDGSGNVVPATAGTDLSIGLSDPVSDVAAGDRIDVTLSGSGEVVAAAAIAHGASVMPAADGKAVTATTGSVAIGWAFEDASADGDIITIHLGRHTAA